MYPLLLERILCQRWHLLKFVNFLQNKLFFSKLNMCNYFDNTYHTMAYANFVPIQGNSNKIQQCQ